MRRRAVCRFDLGGPWSSYFDHAILTNCSRPGEEGDPEGAVRIVESERVGAFVPARVALALLGHEVSERIVE